MKKIQFSFILFIFLMFPIIVLASEARIIPVGSGEVGDCTLIESNGEYLLVDTCIASDYGVLDFLSQYLKNKEVKSLDILISHYHNDHFNLLYTNRGLFTAASSTATAADDWNTSTKPGTSGKYAFFTSKIRNIYLPDPTYMRSYYDNTLISDSHYNYIKNSVEKLSNANTPMRVVQLWSNTNNGNTNHFEFGDIKVDVIGPVDVDCASNCGHEYDSAEPFHGYKQGHYINDHSLVTMFTIGNVKYLSAGDIESSVEVGEGVSNSNLSNYQEEKLVAQKCSQLKADILKLNHHGLETSNGNAFLYCVKPKFAFYSKDNEVYANAVKPQIDQILNDWRHKINMFTTIDSSNGGNGSFAFHIKNNSIEIEKINFDDTNYEIFNSKNFREVTLNYLDDSDNNIGSSKAYFSTKEGAYYYLTDYTPTYIAYEGNDYIYDFQKNSDITTGGTSIPSSVNIYYKKSNYIIDQENKVIKGIDFHLKGTTLYKALGFTTANSAAYYRDNLLDARSDVLRTGDEIRFTMNNRENIYKIAVAGDIEGKGYLTGEGIIKAAKHILDGNVLDVSKSSAADYNDDGVVKMNDILQMLNKINTQKEDNGFVTEESSKYYYDNDTGEMHIGWLNYQNEDYYFNKDGKMVNSWNVIDGRLYYFDENGALVDNMEGYSFNQIQNSEDKPYLIANSGFLELADKKYYSSGDNTFTTGWLHLDDKWYYFDETGKMLKEDWYQIANAPRTDQYWYYFDENGVMLKGWQKLDDKWYYLNDSGRMLKGWQQLEYNGADHWYYFSTAGVMANTGWKNIDYEWYYFFPGGTMATDWEQIDNKWYYFGSSGKMVSSTCMTISGTNYCFNSSGACTNC